MNSRFRVLVLFVALAWVGTARAQTPASTGVDMSTAFDHDVHLSAAKMNGKQMACATCHAMSNSDGSCPKAEVRFPEHEACTGCHAASFYQAPLTICTNCHASETVAKKNPLRELTRQVTPRKAEFPHKSHLDPKMETDCTSCHTVHRGGDVISVPSHPSCCQCHAGPGSNGKKIAEPTMNKCGSCHDTSKSAGRPPSKIHDFLHSKHRDDPRNNTSMRCQSCHANMAEASTLRQIRTPAMPVCVQCHDGLYGFYFGACLKCHTAGSIDHVALPAGHPTTTEVPQNRGHGGWQ